jgi:hypothetical protein
MLIIRFYFNGFSDNKKQCRQMSLFGIPDLLRKFPKNLHRANPENHKGTQRYFNADFSVVLCVTSVQLCVISYFFRKSIAYFRVVSIFSHIG